MFCTHVCVSFRGGLIAGLPTDMDELECMLSNCIEEVEGLHGVFKRLRHNGHLKFWKAANSSAQTVTQAGSPPKVLCV
jgi:hypothetical protein